MEGGQGRVDAWAAVTTSLGYCHCQSVGSVTDVWEFLCGLDNYAEENSPFPWPITSLILLIPKADFPFHRHEVQKSS